MNEMARDVWHIAVELMVAAAVCMVMLMFIGLGQRIYGQAVNARAGVRFPSGVLVSYQTKIVKGVDIVDIIELNNDGVDIIVMGERGGVKYEYIFAASGNLDFNIATAAEFDAHTDLASRLKLRNPVRYAEVDTRYVIGTRAVSEYAIILREYAIAHGARVPFGTDVRSHAFTNELLSSELNSSFIARVYSDNSAGEILRIEFTEI